MSFLKGWMKSEVAPGILLAVCTAAALWWSNSPASSSYFSLLHFHLGPLSLHAWVNDGLMAFFFFAVGMEIKRELLEGQLASPRRAAFPAAAALGGMIAPAACYLFFNSHLTSQNGWGIPMATDIAFALGVLGLFGKRVPASLKVFLLALATVDDLGAVVVIAFFYTEKVMLPALACAASGLSLIYGLQRLRWNYLGLTLALGIFVWAAVLVSGVHATVAGVLLAFLVPVKSGDRRPLDHWLAKVHPWVGFVVMPIFALTNAGLNFSGNANLSSSPVFWGVGLGLALGKPVGIFGASLLSVKLNAAAKPSEVSWPAIVGVSFLGGIGFTMALFVANLALPEAELNIAKVAVLSASALSMALGGLLLNGCLRKRNL